METVIAGLGYKMHIPLPLSIAIITLQVAYLFALARSAIPSFPVSFLCLACGGPSLYKSIFFEH